MATNGTTNGHATAAALDPTTIEATASSLSPPDTHINNWASPGPAAFDFRSDVVTTPTTSMLSAIASTTLLDDVFQADPRPARPQRHHGQPGRAAHAPHRAPHGVLCDHRAHILEWEAGGVASLCGALVKGVVPRNGTHLTLEDVAKHAVLSDDVHACPTRVVSLENTLGGVVTPLAECRRISRWARERGLIMHLDGARLWEAVAAGAGSLQEYCACFDSVSLCFSKGLGAPIGSILVASAAFRKRAMWVRKSIGGGLRQAGVVSAAARVAVEETFLGGKLSACHARARQIAALWEKMGGRLAMPTETNMVWFDLEAAGIGKEEFIAAGEKAGLRLLGGRLVVHYQIGEEAVERLERLMREVLRGRGGEGLEGTVEVRPQDMATTVE
ncbi:pyridoxal phosphate-dependent transferase [Cryomyces antarcticus]